ncbi:DUF1749-domain-containing protein [Sporormia fimetaria CBS 119925]|uniref:DUF1749-domain-containing protein n=1 Tax=Sporormia fimetaria CBS 119925 TaxID=1340428 RepID=A0A6A6V6A5_9PLEO|nr:DUF1749-domain-containing protein [Sporormia fimetaria CBS 119925]
MSEATPQPTPGILHPYTPKLTAFEHSPRTPRSARAKHTLLFLGGLSDGLLTVHYPSVIAKHVPENWRVVEVMISSSYEGWRTGRIARDGEELRRCVGYFRGLQEQEGGKIVVMGHSTGCQGIMSLIVGPLSRISEWKDAESRSADYEDVDIDGVILQGGVSDREAFLDQAKREGRADVLHDTVKRAKEAVEAGKGDDCMARENHIMISETDPPITAYRTWSLLYPGADDDYFSSDTDRREVEAVFGRLGRRAKRVAFLLGEKDPYVPESVDRSALVRMWTEGTEQGGGDVDRVNGGIVKGAEHNLNGQEEWIVLDLVGRVVRFLEGLERG